MFNVRFDTVMARRTLRDLGQQLGEKETAKGISFALNRVIMQGKTVASRKIRDRYRIKKSKLDKQLDVSKSNTRFLRAKLWSIGTPLPVSLFRYRQQKKGVRVTVLGKQSLIPGAFVATMKNGHTGVFARGRYAKDGFKFRKKRIDYGPRKFHKDLPISTIYTVSEGTMFAQPVVMEPVIAKIEEMLPVRLEHELNRLLAKVR